MFKASSKPRAAGCGMDFCDVEAAVLLAKDDPGYQGLVV